jgi:hypothetical protein
MSNNIDISSNLTFSNSKLKSASSCRACGTHITFKRLENGRSVAVQDDNNRHRCAEWKTWRADY